MFPKIRPVGVRRQQEEQDAAIRQEVTMPGLSLLSARLLVAQNSGDLDRSTDEVTWSITPQYFINEDTTVYATAAHGFKSGAFNINWGTTPLDQRQFGDEDIMHYEAGLKSTLLDGRMQLAFSAFYIEYNDYQDAAFISQQFFVGNAEKAELKGVELEGKLLLGEYFSTDFAVSYADLTYDEFSDGLCHPGRTPDNPETGTCDLSGEHPINAPEWTTHLGVMYQNEVSRGEIYAWASRQRLVPFFCFWSITDFYLPEFPRTWHTTEHAKTMAAKRTFKSMRARPALVSDGRNLPHDRLQPRRFGGAVRAADPVELRPIL